MPNATGFNPWMAGITAASGLISGISGLVQKHKARKILDNLQYPIETIPTAIRQNKDLATNAANTGLPQEQYNNTLKNIQRNQLMTLRAGLDRGGVLGSLAKITQLTNDATANLDAKDAQARQQNQKTLYGINNTYGNWQNKVWDNNVKQKYLRDYNYGMSLMGSGNQNFVNGIDKVASGAAQFGLTGGFNRRPNPNRSYTNGMPDYSQPQYDDTQ